MTSALPEIDIKNRPSGPGCPPWCAVDYLADNGMVNVHVSAERVVDATGDEHERGPSYVSLEQVPGKAAAIRIDGGRTPMTAAEALELADVLADLAALAAVGVSTPDTLAAMNINTPRPEAGR